VQEIQDVGGAINIEGTFLVTAPTPPRSAAALVITDDTAKSKKKAKAKPVWALTDKQAEEREDEDVDDLISFAESLDYEKYVQDTDVQDALQKIKERVEELEDASEDEDAFDAEGDDASVPLVEKGATSALAKKIRKTAAEEVMNCAQDEDTRSEAPTVYSTARDLRKDNKALGTVHSTASVKAMLDKVRANENALPGQPRIVDHRQFAGKDVDPSNLPYLHRNPAV
jgi:hypothetical protein